MEQQTTKLFPNNPLARGEVGRVHAVLQSTGVGRHLKGR